MERKTRSEHFTRDDYKAVAAGLDDVFNNGRTGKDRTIGFALFVFSFGDDPKDGGPRVNYVSNADRHDMIEALEDWLTQAKKQIVDDPIKEGQP